MAAYVSQAVSTDAYRFRARVTVHAPARVVSERLSGVAGRIGELDADRCVVHTGGESLEGLAIHLGFLGLEFEVHERVIQGCHPSGMDSGTGTVYLPAWTNARERDMPQERIYGPGESIGPFKVVRLLGSGALGTVYEAKPDPLEREDLVVMGMTPVAIKVARLDAIARTAEERRKMVERLGREYQTLLKLGDPGYAHLPRVYEFGWHDCVPFLVMEHVDGPSLEDVLALQPAMQSMLEVFRKLCAAVAVLHVHGVVHRDIHPGNVLMCGEEPMLIDFSHCLPPSGLRITGADELVGTALYASPQADGHALAPESERPYLATPQDDVWALGVLLYRMLTGDEPWESPPHHREALVREMLRGPLRHPSEVNPQVPRAVGDVALALLQPEPALRPLDAIAVLKELEPVLRDCVVQGQVPDRLRTRRSANVPSAQAAIRPVARARSVRGRGRKILRVAAVVLLALGGDGVGRLGLEVMRQVRGGVAWTAALLGGAKAGLAAALPVPPEPLPGQMRAPCSKQYVETSGGCWTEIPMVTPEGKPQLCDSTNTYIREKKEKDGRVRCLLAVMGSTPNTEEPAKDKR